MPADAPLRLGAAMLAVTSPAAVPGGGVVIQVQLHGYELTIFTTTGQASWRPEAKPTVMGLKLLFGLVKATSC